MISILTLLVITDLHCGFTEFGFTTAIYHDLSFLQKNNRPSRTVCGVIRTKEYRRVNRRYSFVHLYYKITLRNCSCSEKKFLKRFFARMAICRAILFRTDGSYSISVEASSAAIQARHVRYTCSPCSVTRSIPFAADRRVPPVTREGLFSPE